jgi:predicted DNA-binding transcriptional regulator YafY
MAALKYGSNARVLGPPELRDEIEKEIRAMAAKYEQL